MSCARDQQRPLSGGRSIRPCEPRTSFASSGITSISVRKPRFLRSSFIISTQLRAFDPRIDEQLDRVISRLAVNIDAAGEIRRAVIIEPVVIAEPTAALSDQNESPARS
jgi:hypothetical protein